MGKSRHAFASLWQHDVAPLCVAALACRGGDTMPRPLTVAASRSSDARSQVLKGTLWMVGGALALTVMGALIRLVSNQLPVATTLCFRNGISLVVVLGWVAARGRLHALRSQRRRWHFARALCGALSFGFLVLAYRRLDFALATALAYTTPLWMIVLSVFFLGERPGVRRSVATVFGFVGVLVILRPLPILDIGVLSAMASAVFGACALSYVRWLSGHEPTESLLFHFFAFGALLSAPFAVGTGVLPEAGQLAVLCAISLAGTIGLGCAAQAYRLADATIIAPVDFLRLPVAGAIGIVFFAEVPQVSLIVGTAIMAAALYAIVTLGSRPGHLRGRQTRNGSPPDDAPE